MPVTLVTGPVRSGKSRYVVTRAQQSARRVRYVATAMRVPDDAEWNARLQRHADDRPAGWELIESALLEHEQLLDIFRTATESECIVVDALGTWLAARIATSVAEFEENYERFEARMDEEAAALGAAMLVSKAHVIVVSEEVGWDIVPMAASARLFRDVLGRAKQLIAAEASEVFLVVCGYALDLRALGVSF